MKPPLLLLTGWAHGRESLVALAEAFERAQRFSEITMTTGLDAARHELDSRARPAVLWGWSMGALMALELALDAPDRVAALVLTSATPRFCRAEDYPCGWPAATVREMQQRLAVKPAATLRLFFRDVAAPFPPRDGELPKQIAGALALGGDKLAAGLEYLAGADARARVGALAPPVLLMHGRQDRIIPWEAAQWIADQAPRATLHLVEDMGHDLPLRNPDLIVHETLRFLPPSA